ncbi:G5 domain-containing protein, partial [Streptococcus suis]|nr:G5 domain-containing protein [Streptococcus suis]
EGKEGVRTIVETVTYTDGVETNRVVKSDTVTTPAINKVIKVGTKKIASLTEGNKSKVEDPIFKKATSQKEGRLPETGTHTSTSFLITLFGFLMIGIAFIKKRIKK